MLQERLSIATCDRQLEGPMDVAFLNTKGFGGNNASASILSPDLVRQMLRKRYGKQAISTYQSKHQQTFERANLYNNSYLQGNFKVIYRFGERVTQDDDIDLDAEKIHISGYNYGKDIDLTVVNPYRDMVDTE